MSNKINTKTFVIAFSLLIIGVLGYNFIHAYINPYVNTLDASQTIIKTSNSTVTYNITLNQVTNGNTLIENTLNISSLIVNQNYTINYTTGLVSMNNTANNTYTALYKFHDALYDNDSTDRVILNIFPILLLIVLFLFFKLEILKTDK